VLEPEPDGDELDPVPLVSELLPVPPIVELEPVDPPLGLVLDGELSEPVVPPADEPGPPMLLPVPLLPVLPAELPDEPPDVPPACA
jgi:hypothetical protein